MERERERTGQTERERDCPRWRGGIKKRVQERDKEKEGLPEETESISSAG